MRGIRDLLAHAFAACGIATVQLNEESQDPGDLTAAMVIAPHEFFNLGNGERPRDVFPVERAIMLNVEPAHAPQFARGLPFLARAASVVDIDVHSSAALRQLGIEAHFLPLRYSAGFLPYSPVEVLPDVLAFKGLPDCVRRFVPSAADQLRDRPVDLVFVGEATDRRRRFFARSAEAFSRFHCFLSLDDTTPGYRTAATLLDAAAIVGLVQRSKIILNVHHDERPYMEWRRVVHHGIGQRALVVSEPCAPVPGLRPGEHFLECRLSEMPDLVTWLLTTEAGAARAEAIRARGYEALVRDFDLTVWLKALVPGLLVDGS